MPTQYQPPFNNFELDMRQNTTRVRGIVFGITRQGLTFMLADDTDEVVLIDPHGRWAARLGGYYQIVCRPLLTRIGNCKYMSVEPGTEVKTGKFKARRIAGRLVELQVTINGQPGETLPGYVCFQTLEIGTVRFSTRGVYSLENNASYILPQEIHGHYAHSVVVRPDVQESGLHWNVSLYLGQAQAQKSIVEKRHLPTDDDRTDLYFLDQLDRGYDVPGWAGPQAQYPVEPPPRYESRPASAQFSHQRSTADPWALLDQVWRHASIRAVLSDIDPRLATAVEDAVQTQFGGPAPAPHQPMRVSPPRYEPHPHDRPQGSYEGPRGYRLSPGARVYQEGFGRNGPEPTYFEDQNVGGYHQAPQMPGPPGLPYRPEPRNPYGGPYDDGY
ncbi:unnamed protein product, partial [Mesorhabditis spiculigera]